MKLCTWWSHHSEGRCSLPRPRGRRHGSVSGVDCLQQRIVGRGHGLCLYETSTELRRRREDRKEGGRAGSRRNTNTRKENDSWQAGNKFKAFKAIFSIYRLPFLISSRLQEASTWIIISWKDNISSWSLLPLKQDINRYAVAPSTISSDLAYASPHQIKSTHAQIYACEDARIHLRRKH